jgi:hypothetical protein
LVLSVPVLASISVSQEPENSKGASRFFFTTILVLFKDILGAVFKNTISNPTKIKQGTVLDPSLPKEWFFERQLWGTTYAVFITISTSVKSS